MDFDLLAAARELIAADSVSANGNLRAVAVLEEVAARLGLDSRRMPAEALGTQHANLLVYPRGAPPRDGGLLLVTHTDTVGSGPLERWTQTNPWVLKQDGDTLFGLGVADVKLDALAKLEAIAHAPRAAHGKVAFLGTFAEEVGCLGARQFLKERPFTPAWVSCGEPSELRIIDAHKGYLVAKIHVRDPAAPQVPHAVRLVFEGKAAHSSTPHLGENAIERALAFCDAQKLSIIAAEGGDLANKVPASCVITVEARDGLEAAAIAAGVQFEAIGAPLKSSRRAIETAVELARALAGNVAQTPPARDDRFDPPTTVSNLGVVRASDGEVTLTIDARLLPGHDPEALFGALDARAAEVGGLAVRIERDRSNPAMALPARSRLRDAAMETSRALGLNPTPQAKPTNTEGGVFVSAGMEAIIFGPGRSTGNAHCANEWQSLSQLQEAARYYGRLIPALCT